MTLANNIKWIRGMHRQIWNLAFPALAAARRRQYRLNNLEERKRVNREYQAEHPDRRREACVRWRKNHPEKAREASRVGCRKWYHASLEHKAKARTRVANRRSKQRCATPVDCDRTAVENIYARAARWRDRGFNVEVDHIFPLGFGWHEPDNLQIIYEGENRTKGCQMEYSPKVVFL